MLGYSMYVKAKVIFFLLHWGAGSEYPFNTRWVTLKPFTRFSKVLEKLFHASLFFSVFVYIIQSWHFHSFIQQIFLECLWCVYVPAFGDTAVKDKVPASGRWQFWGEWGEKTVSKHTLCLMVGRRGRGWVDLSVMFGVLVHIVLGVTLEGWLDHYFVTKEERALWNGEKGEGRKAIKANKWVLIQTS